MWTSQKGVGIGVNGGVKGRSEGGLGGRSERRCVGRCEGWCDRKFSRACAGSASVFFSSKSPTMKHTPPAYCEGRCEVDVGLVVEKWMSGWMEVYTVVWERLCWERVRVFLEESADAVAHVARVVPNHEAGGVGQARASDRLRGWVVETVGGWVDG